MTVTEGQARRTSDANDGDDSATEAERVEEDYSWIKPGPTIWTCDELGIVWEADATPPRWMQSPRVRKNARCIEAECREDLIDIISIYRGPGGGHRG